MQRFWLLTFWMQRFSLHRSYSHCIFVCKQNRCIQKVKSQNLCIYKAVKNCGFPHTVKIVAFCLQTKSLHLLETSQNCRFPCTVKPLHSVCKQKAIIFTLPECNDFMLTQTRCILCPKNCFFQRAVICLLSVCKQNCFIQKAIRIVVSTLMYHFLKTLSHFASFKSFYKTKLAIHFFTLFENQVCVFLKSHRNFVVFCVQTKSLYSGSSEDARFLCAPKTAAFGGNKIRYIQKAVKSVVFYALRKE